MNLNKSWVAGGLVLLAACGGNGGSGGAAVSLSARVGTSTAVTRSASAGLVVANGVSLDRARIVLRQLRVERRAEGAEVKISDGPLLIDVSGDALGGSVQDLVNANIPAGTYDKLKISVHSVATAPAGAPAALADLVARRASVLLEGTVDGQRFTFASGLEAELEHESEFTVGGSAANITVNLDPTAWFKDSTGARLDPNDSAQRAAIEANIRASFSAFQDDDHEGREHHNDDHGGRADGGVDDRGGHHDGGEPGDDNGGHHDGGEPGDDHGGGDGGHGGEHDGGHH